MRRPRDDLDRWGRRHASARVALGIPTTIVEDHRRFLLAVQNAEDAESGWTSGRVEGACVGALLSLLLEVFADLGRELIADLQRRAAA